MIKARNNNGNLETRMFTGAEFRIQDDGSSTVKVSGYALTYSQPYKVYDGGPGGFFTEEILPGAARNAAKSGSCILQVNHSGIALARFPTTLRLESDAKGLRYEADLDTRSAAATDLLVALERKDIRSSSFGFKLSPGDDSWDAKQTHRKIRNITEIYDVSPVNSPANPTATASIEGRSIYVAEFVTGAREQITISSGRPRMTTMDLKREHEAAKRSSGRRTTMDLKREFAEDRRKRQRDDMRRELAKIAARRAQRAAKPVASAPARTATSAKPALTATERRQQISQGLYVAQLLHDGYLSQ